MPPNAFSKKDRLTITTLGFEFAVAVAGGSAIGFFADKKLGSSPWLLIAGMLIGFALGLYIIIGAAKELDKQTLTASNTPKDKNEDGHR